MNKERIDDLVDVLGEQYAKVENTFVIRNQQELVRFANNPEKWHANQVANQRRYKGVLIAQAKEQLKMLNDTTERAFLLSYNEIEKDTIEVTRTEIKGNIPKSYANKIAQAKKENLAQVLALANVALKTHISTVRIISSLSTPDNLYDTIKRQMNKGIENGLKIVTGQGDNQRNWTFKSYMEMNVRTTIHQELTKEQLKLGAELGQIFYVCDTYADSRPDHADYQGKLYYNAEADIPPEIEKWIANRGLQSTQEVSEGEPYLTSSPNCRHNFHAIPTEEAMGKSIEDILKDEKLEKGGDYKDGNYDKTQEQRYNERTIRKYKLREEANAKLYDTTKDPNFLKRAEQDGALVRSWQSRNRELIKDNPDLLKRDYDRENIRVITQDLGVRYDIRKDIRENK